MYCKQCGTQFASDHAAVCLHCGCSRGQGMNHCDYCGSKIEPNATVCLTCGAPTHPVIDPNQQKSKIAAGLFGLFLGVFGVHNFYLGYTAKAIVQVSVSSAGLLLICCTLGFSIFATAGIGLWGLIEGIIILAGGIKVDGKGIPLKD